MELAIAAAGKLFSSIGLSGAAGAGASGAGAAGAATAGATGLKALGGFATALSVLGGIGSGLSAKAQADQAAMQTDLQAGQETNQAVQRQTAMKRQLLQVLGENDVTFASAGIDISGGIAQSTAADARKRAAQEISIDRQDTDFRRAMLRMRASGQRAQGRSALGGALLGAVGKAAGAGMRAGKIGGGGGGSGDPWLDLRTVG
jgi:hypothetical protein